MRAYHHDSLEEAQESEMTNTTTPSGTASTPAASPTTPTRVTVTSADAALVNKHRTAKQGYVREGDEVNTAELDKARAAERPATTEVPR